MLPHPLELFSQNAKTNMVYGSYSNRDGCRASSAGDVAVRERLDVAVRERLDVARPRTSSMSFFSVRFFSMSFFHHQSFFG